MVKSHRERRCGQSPEGYHPFRKWEAACGLPFITGQIEYGESYFANGLVFDDSAEHKTAEAGHSCAKPLALLQADHNLASQPQSKKSSKKRLSSDFMYYAPNTNDENIEPEAQFGYVTSPKKQKFLPPAPRQKREQAAEGSCNGGGEATGTCGDYSLPFEAMESCDRLFQEGLKSDSLRNDAKFPDCNTCENVCEEEPAKSKQQTLTKQPSLDSEFALAMANIGLSLDANAKTFTPTKAPRAPPKAAKDADCDMSMSLFDLTQTEVPAAMMGRIRVIQRNLMYVTNMPPTMADQRKASAQHFGEFGTVARLVIRTIPASKPHQSPVVSAYVTYVEEASTALAIAALNGKFVDAKRLRASFGSNKYCNAFIRNEPCTNPRCSYLHQLSGTHECFWEKNNNPMAPSKKHNKVEQKSADNHVMVSY